jgi:hypothetical protein
MKISERDLRRIIKEELNYLNEDDTTKIGGLGGKLDAALRKSTTLVNILDKATTAPKAEEVLAPVVNQIADNIEDPVEAETLIVNAVKLLLSKRKKEALNQNNK